MQLSDGERKEFLSQGEHAELLALVDFAHKRTIEKLEDQAALDRLRAALLGVMNHPDLISIRRLLAALGSPMEGGCVKIALAGLT